MTRPFDKHLDSDELESLVSLQGTSVSASEQLSELDLRAAKRHVESCQDCSRKLQRHTSVHSEILRMRAPNSSLSTFECLVDAEWLEVAAGLLPEAKTRELMKHAAQCGHCGPLLKNAASLPQLRSIGGIPTSVWPTNRTNRMMLESKSRAGVLIGSRAKCADGASHPLCLEGHLVIGASVGGWLPLR